MAPEFLQTRLDGPVLLEPTVHSDDRGFFLETYREDVWQGLGVDSDFVQQNHSRSIRGTIRGIHYQTSPGQAKLVRCVRGQIFDVVVDLRADSASFGEWEGYVLDDRNHHQIYVPIGFGHGFCVLSEEADVHYLVSSYFDPATEAGICWNDPDLSIEWPVEEPVVSERDRKAPLLAQVIKTLPF